MSQAPASLLRVMIVDGSAAVRRTLGDATRDAAGLELAGTAINANTASAKLDSYLPDVVAIDLDTPAVRGQQLVSELRAQRPDVRCVLLVGDPTAHAAISERVPDCMIVDRPDAGAPDPILTDRFLAALFRVGGRTPGDHVAAAVTSNPAPPAPAPARNPTAANRADRRAPEVIAIGTSTGGPQALAQVLPALRADFPLPILIVQHMPREFTASLAESLANICELPVREAVDGEPVRRGEVLIAPGGRHLGVRRTREGVFVELADTPPEQSCRPAVDYLFRSLAAAYGAATFAVVMTGMGEDGLQGCAALHECGARIITQDQASCTVYGMPRGPAERGLVEAVVPLTEIGPRIQETAMFRSHDETARR